jgi:hypothetical protein
VVNGSSGVKRCQNIPQLANMFRLRRLGRPVQKAVSAPCGGLSVSSRTVTCHVAHVKDNSITLALSFAGIREGPLLPKEELNRVWILRKVLNPLSPVETMELLLDKLGKTRSNAEFLGSMSG